MKLFILIFLSTLLFSCDNSGGSGSGSGSSAKSLFAIWTRTDLVIALNLSNGSFGSFSMVWTLNNGAQCVSTISMSGTESSGSYSVSGSTYVNGTGSGSDPGCSSLNETGTYSKSGNVLTICTTGGSCGVYN